ncbi:MAG: PhoH family protein [Alphaproteobacteria bacterium]|nr:PhoH family protein [Alphaproteobacteria bacterium]
MSKNGNGSEYQVSVTFQDNSVLPLLYGESDAHLSKIERKLNISASSRGNTVVLSGEKAAAEAGRAALESLYADARKGRDISSQQVDAAIRMASTKPDAEGRNLFGAHDVVIRTMKKDVKPFSVVQAKYIESLHKHDMVFALGPAGTGKTYLAVAMAVYMFTTGRVEKIILSRPAVEAGEKLGFLPGDLKEKIDPYLRPLYDALFDMMPAEKLERHMETGEIEVAPLAFMRGRTLSNAFVILDEAQNTTATQMKMFLTRMGQNTRMVITGDLSQVDLPKDVKSGLGDAIRKVTNITGIDTIKFSDSDVVRHDLAAKIVQAYEEWDKKKRGMRLVDND